MRLTHKKATFLRSNQQGANSNMEYDYKNTSVIQQTPIIFTK